MLPLQSNCAGGDESQRGEEMNVRAEARGGEGGSDGEQGWLTASMRGWGHPSSPRREWGNG